MYGKYCISDRGPLDCTFYLVSRYISSLMQNILFTLELLKIYSIKEPMRGKILAGGTS